MKVREFIDILQHLDLEKNIYLIDQRKEASIAYLYSSIEGCWIQIKADTLVQDRIDIKVTEK